MSNAMPRSTRRAAAIMLGPPAAVRCSLSLAGFATPGTKVGLFGNAELHLMPRQCFSISTCSQQGGDGRRQAEALMAQASCSNSRSGSRTPRRGAVLLVLKQRCLLRQRGFQTRDCSTPCMQVKLMQRPTLVCLEAA